MTWSNGDKYVGIFKDGKLTKGNKIIQSYSENIKIRLLIEKSFVKKIFVNYFDISYELDCKTKFKNNPELFLVPSST